MKILELFVQLDELILRNFGDLEQSRRTERGKLLYQQILAEENRADLRAWYKKLRDKELNSLAAEIKQKLESEIGEEL